MTEPNPPLCSVCADDTAPVTQLDEVWVCIQCLAAEVTRHRTLRNDLRDQFAGQVLASPLLNDSFKRNGPLPSEAEAHQAIAATCYRLADAMLAARGK